MGNEIVELPDRKGRTNLPANTDRQTEKRGLTERQKDMAIEGSVQVLTGVVSIARDIMDIAKIRASAAADVARIDAQTREVVGKMKMEVEMITAKGKSTLSKGQAAAAVIEATMKHIPESDTAARDKALDMLKSLVAQVTGEDGNEGRE